MQATQSRMMVVAVVVCGFAVGMAGLLNYFKYRSTAQRLIAERLAVTGKSVENAIQSSLALGLQFSDIGTLPGTLDRERATDRLIQGIDIFDHEGKMLYSTDSLRSARPVPEGWLAASKRAGQSDWQVEDGDDAAVGMTVENNFGQAVGHLALRYSGDRVRAEVHAVGRQLALQTLGVFSASAVLACLAVLVVIRRLSIDVRSVESALRSGDTHHAVVDGPFGAALRRFLATTREAEREIAGLRAKLVYSNEPKTIARPMRPLQTPAQREQAQGADA